MGKSFPVGKGPLDIAGEPPRQGVQRASQKVNTLLLKTELGKVKACATALPPEDFAYGLQRPRDAEGAREVTLKWVEHEPNPNAKPGPDFKGMNFLAAINDVTTSKEQRSFRAAHPMTLKQGLPQGRLTQRPPLPSDYNPEYTYGRSNAVRTHEEIRVLGGTQPHIKNIVQGSFANDWVARNMARQQEFEADHARLPPSATKASEGHASRAKAAFDPVDEMTWKMKKFTKVKCKVNSNNKAGHDMDYA